MLLNGSTGIIETGSAPSLWVLQLLGKRHQIIVKVTALLPSMIVVITVNGTISNGAKQVVGTIANIDHKVIGTIIDCCHGQIDGSVNEHAISPIEKTLLLLVAQRTGPYPVLNP